MKDVLDSLKKAIEEGQAKDAAKAVQAALDGGAEPGAILRDVMVPAMDGWAAATSAATTSCRRC